MTPIVVWLLVSALIGFLAWLITTRVPMDNMVKTVIQIGVAVALVLWLIHIIAPGALVLGSLVTLLA